MAVDEGATLAWVYLAWLWLLPQRMGLFFHRQSSIQFYYHPFLELNNYNQSDGGQQPNVAHNGAKFDDTKLFTYFHYHSPALSKIGILDLTGSLPSNYS